MKTLPLISAVAALVAFMVVPTPAVAGTVFFGLSLVTIFAADYTQAYKPLTPRASVVPFTKPTRIVETCEQAA